MANLASILTVPNLPHIASDGSFISRSKRREWLYGTIANKDDESDAEDEVVTAANANQEAEENARKASAMSSVAIGEKLGIGKKDWNLLVFGSKKTPAASLEESVMLSSVASCTGWLTVHRAIRIALSGNRSTKSSFTDGRLELEWSTIKPDKEIRARPPTRLLLLSARYT